jgi:hypothetical protein
MNALYTIPPPPPVVPINPEPKEKEPEPEPEPETRPAGEDEEMGDESRAPPTTRSKTAPLRQATSSSPAPNPAIKRGVMTLADIHSAHAVLAEKANQHWAKGLGGGQNREGETIVNFLYKNKVGHSELNAGFNSSHRPLAARVQPRAGAVQLGVARHGQGARSVTDTDTLSNAPRALHLTGFCSSPDRPDVRMLYTLARHRRWWRCRCCTSCDLLWHAYIEMVVK